MLRCGSLTVEMLAVSDPLRMSSCSPGDGGPHIIRPASCSPSRTGDVEAAGVRQAGAFAMPTYGRLATEHDASAHDRLESELERHLAAARDRQDRLGDLMRADPPPGRPPGRCAAS